MGLARRVAAVSVCTVFLTVSCSHTKPRDALGIVEHTLKFAGSSYQYYLFIPPSPVSTEGLPLLLLVHGGGGNGFDFLRLWKEFGQQHNIVLVAPTLRLGADLERRVPDLFPAFVEDVKSNCRQISLQRVYLFGYSAGGYSTFDAATLASSHFAAATVLAGVITPDYDWIVEGTQRKTPIAMYIGDRDESFSLTQAQRTRNVLLAHGFPLHYVEIPQPHFNYSGNLAWVQEDSWRFMSKYALP